MSNIRSFSNSAYHYHSIFGDICSTRFQKLARFIFSSTWILTIIIALPSKLEWWNILLPFRALPIALGLFLLACLRKNNLHVDYLGYKTLSNQVIGQLLDKKQIFTFIIYWISSYLFFFTVHSQIPNLTLRAVPKKHQYPPLNDEYVFYYFYSAFISITYSFQHIILDRDRLTFYYDKFHTSPKDALIKKMPNAISNTILSSISNAIFAPIIYLFLRYLIYDIIFFVLGLFVTLNQSYPSFHISIGFFIEIVFISSIVILSWEVLNYAFNAYLSIGCLHRGSPISELSTDPLGTLLTGLKSDKLFTKLTAFQELAYISKSESKEGRLTIYNRNHRREYAWIEILREIEKVIKQNNSNINTVLLKSLPTHHVSNPVFKRKESNIFGVEYYNDETDFKDDLFIHPSHTEDPQSFFDSNIITLVISNLKEAAELIKKYYNNFIASGFGIPFRYTIRREAERLSPTPVIVANAIVALSLLSRNAYDEDIKGTVSSTISEVLEILEKSVSCCGKFIQNPPDYLVEKEDENVISLLHELSLSGFYEVTMKYSNVLKDVVLSPDVAHLVNWTLEVAYKENLDDDEF